MLGINKNSFKRYQRSRNNQSNRRRQPQDFGYICPQTVSVRNYFNRADLIFIILASSNFLHSDTMFDQLTNDLHIELPTFAFPQRSSILMV
ncbi:uncharacterized protein OCT59_019210 [Rhizophagus irregularis]|uniref:uncharacterized protein n=1 Tax=Rhizophagus irregularis TaxID=588596 RepID=UPI003316FBAD|nr:hypothetical protein OCT59_019210 [Rhizophagus irregularis]